MTVLRDLKRVGDKYEAVVVGAGVVGPAVAVGLARQGRKVLLVERDWREPDRIVGELMQPVGLRALKSLGMVQAVNNIDAIVETGYTVIREGDLVNIPYPFKADVDKTEPIENCVFGGNDKILDDSTLKASDFEDDERERGVSFEHGKFISNLRKIAENEANITCLEATANEVMTDPKTNEITGVKIKTKDEETKEITAGLTIICDGIFSKFRKTLSPDYSPDVKSHFIALKLRDAVLPVKNTGHVILGSKFAPILVYQITPTDTRVLCAYNDAKLPKDIKKYLSGTVLPNLPEVLRPSFEHAIEHDVIKTMPNSYLPAKLNDKFGLLVLGDALNMRHPLTGGGMSVGLNDAAMVVKNLGKIKDLNNKELTTEVLINFHYDRKNLDGVINILSIALYSLFAANDSNLVILQRGCFAYFERGGDCISIPVGFLSGLIPRPFLLTWVFFKVAFYSILINFIANGVLYFPLSILQVFTVIFTAVKVFTPYLWIELFT